MIEWCSALEWPAAGLVSDWSGISIVFVDVGTREHDIALVLYSPAVSCTDCCQIAVGLWIAIGLVGL